MCSRLAQPLKFLLVGIGGFVLNLCAFTALFGLGTWYLAASVLGYLVSNAAMYLGNRYFTFGLSHCGFLHAYLRYLVVGGVVAALTALLARGIRRGPRDGSAARHRRSRSQCSCLCPFVLSKRFAFQLRPA